MRQACFSIAALLLSLISTSCVYAPPADYLTSSAVQKDRHQLYARLIAFLPPEERQNPAAQKEALWLSHTAYKAAAEIARLNDPRYTCWLNNRLVNSGKKERGLCWHYQEDMYRELRRRHLEYFRIGCCVRDQGNRHEHHCVYLALKQTPWPCALILDAWRYNGRLLVLTPADFCHDNWKDEPDACAYLASVFLENHTYPLEYWARVRSDEKNDLYISSKSKEGRCSRQGQLMWQRIRQRGITLP